MEEESNIENFFKKRLEANEFEYQEADWEHLEKKLDAAGLVTAGNILPFGSMKLWLSGLTIITMAFLAGWFMRGAQRPTYLINENETTPTTVVEAPYWDWSFSKYQSQSLELGGRNDKTVRTEIKNPVVHATAGKSPDQIPLERDPTPATLKEPGGYNESIRVVPLGLILSDSVMTTRNVLPMDPEQQPYPFAKGRWSFGLSVAPDFNSVGSFSQSTYSLKTGVLVFFRLAKRWTVSGGAFYNQKKYTTIPEKYTPPEGYWKARTNGVIPERIIGSCGVLDLPVKIIYDLNTKGRWRFSAAAGVSNYLLLDEYYDFEFSTPNPGASESWQTTENSNVPAGVVNLSFMAHIPLSSKMDLLIEPYLQTPVKSMGWGEVDLYSAGSLFTLRYTPFRQTNKFRNGYYLNKN